MYPKKSTRPGWLYFRLGLVLLVGFVLAMFAIAGSQTTEANAGGTASIARSPGELAGPGNPASPHAVANGKIAFASSRDGNVEIYVMEADGSNQVRLTNDPLVDQDPSWSPDGTKLAFSSSRTGTHQIYIMDPDGSNLFQVTYADEDCLTPVWSPDGTRLAYYKELDRSNYDVFIINANGTGEVNLTNSNPQLEFDPDWSPDGSKIIFERTDAGFSNGIGIYEINVDGTGLNPLSDVLAADLDPAYSPDGSKIALESQRDINNNEIYVFDADGSNPVRLTNDPAFDKDPNWAPDSSKLVFSSNRQGNYNIFAMNPDGSSPTPLTTQTAGDDVSPDWQAVQVAPGTPTVPVPTPSPCTLQFPDVTPSDPFYAYIRCLVCRGVIGGYPDGTFKSGNPILRGQLTKMVANSAGFLEPISGQMYTDVPPSETFYLYIERMTRRGLVAGYPCGTVPEEPCDEQSRPYFRPVASATRGQISKIVANGASFTEQPGDQIYEDVPPGSPFYDYINRLSRRGVMSGYPCGSVGEPCGQDGKPYFRPNKLATRGQTSKIVANTFFPNCETP